MSNEVPSPLGEAIESMGEAAQAYLDGPLAHLRAAANRAARPDYGSNAATADVALYGLHLARAFWLGVSKAGDAMAILAVPPGDGYRFEVGIPVVSAPSTVSIVATRWTWTHSPEPEGAEISLTTPPVLAPTTDRVRLHARPLILTGEPSWEVDLEITPLGPSAGQKVRVALDASTRIFDR